MKLYRFLTGPDDASFCHRVSKEISNGWELHGSPTLSFDTAAGKMVAGQAIIKEVPGGTYQDDIKLSDY